MSSGIEMKTLRKGQLNRHTTCERVSRIDTQGTDQPLPHETQSRRALWRRAAVASLGARWTNAPVKTL